jgi:dTDP-glucose 4,6-dehydratase
MTRRHIITGGSGFVGQRLAEALRARGEPVVIFDITAPADSAVDFVAGSIQHPGDIARLHLAPGDVVHHLAARQFHGAVPRHHRDSWFAAVNTTGTRHLLSAMSARGAKQLIFFSTDMTYGLPQTNPVLPTHPQAPIGPYGQSKLAAEKLILAAGADHGLQATIFRPRLIAGAGRLGILARLFQLVAWNLPVPMIGSGENRYQMIAAEDCVAAALRAVDCGFPAGPFNLGSAEPPTVRELLGDLIARAGSHSILVPTPARAVQSVLGLLDRAGMTLLYPEQFAIADSDYTLDTTATSAALGWSPARRDEDIIFEAFSHFRRAAGGASTIPELAAASAE